MTNNLQKSLIGALALIISGLIANGSITISLITPDRNDPTTDQTSTLLRDAERLSQHTPVSGILLLGPHYDTWDRRSHILKTGNHQMIGWMYDITYPKAITRLQQQDQVELIVENKKYKQYNNDFGELQAKLDKRHITLYPDEKLGISFTHAKAMVGDERRTIQTANLNRTSFVENREHFFLSNDAEIRRNLIDLFTLDKKKITNPDSVERDDYHTLVQEFSPYLLVCPIQCREVIEYYLRHAKHRIRISAQYVSDPTILSLLEDKKNLDIRVRTNTMDSNNKLLRQLRPEQRLMEKGIYNHDKLLVIDDIAIMGSMNLSENALDKNRELGIILTDPKLIEQLLPLRTQ